MNIYEEALRVGSSRLHETAMVLWRTEGENPTYTFAETFERVDAFADVLAGVGMQRGFRVAISAESCPEWAFAYFAVLKLGGTPALIDASLPDADLQDLLGQSDPACIYASKFTFEKLGDCGDLPILDVHGGGQAFAGCEGHRCPTTLADCDENVASIIFSSGTTRRASGIMHSAESIVGSTLMCCNNNGVFTGSRFFGVLPNSHIYGLYVQVIAPFVVGGSVCFIESLDAACLVGALQGYKPTVFPAVPKVFELLRTNILIKINSDPKTAKLFKMFFPICLKLRKKTGINLGKVLFKSVGEGFGGHIHIMASAGAPTDEETAEFYYGCGIDLLITYGATETSIPVIGNYGGHLTTDTCGRPYPEVTISQTPEGEFLVKSPYLMMGYFRDEEATRASYDAEGWFKTGDQGTVDAQQNIRFSGRVKDNIVLATGKKVAPDDIEAAYAGIPGVRDMAICGIPVSAGGYDTVHAFIVADESEQDSLRAALTERGRSLGQNMKLHGVHFVEAIPKTTLQKPKRFLLGKLMEEGADIASTPLPVPAARDLAGFLRAIVARLAGVTEADVADDTRIFEDLAVDSLGAIELQLEMEAFTGCEMDGSLPADITLAGLVALAGSLEASIPPRREPFFTFKNKRGSDYGLFSIGRWLMSSCYDISVYNDNLLPEDSGYIICANHVTNFDYLLVTAKFQKERFMTFCCMAKQELFKKNPVNDLLIRIAGMIPVDRDGNATGSMKAAKEKLAEKWGLLIHPEGTRSRNGEMGQFKPGAALLALESGVPIVPAYIRGGYEVFPADRTLPRFFNWKARKKFKIEVIYGEPISPENQTVDTLMQQLGNAVLLMARGDTLATSQP